MRRAPARLRTTRVTILFASQRCSAARQGRRSTGAAGPVPAGRQPTGCPGCQALLDDITAIAAALPEMAIPPRPREFALSVEQADRLRRRGLAGLLGRVGTARDAVTRPLAVAFTTLGLAGFLVAAAPVGLPFAGGGAASLAPEAIPDAVTRSAASVPVDAPGQADGPRGGAPSIVPALPMTAVDGATGPTPLQVLSGTFLAVGGSLFGMRRLAGRQGMR